MGKLEDIVIKSGMLKPKVLLPILLTVLPIVHNGCTVPPGYAKRMGWEQKEKDDGKTPYERSLRSEFLEEGDMDPNNDWRILNYMMFYLARGKADFEGANSETKPLLSQIQQLNVVYDSTEVMNLYKQIFADEDTRWASDDRNEFIEKELIARMDQVSTWNGFDTYNGLNEWGQLITRWGPFTLESFGDGYVVGVFKNGLTYKAEEQPDFSYKITQTAQGPINRGAAPDDPLGELEGVVNSGGNMAEAESQMLKSQHQHDMSVPTEYKQLDLRALKVTRLPAPKGGAWKGLDASFFAEPWTTNRFIVDVYGNLKEFTLKEKLGETVLPFTLEYIVNRVNNNGTVDSVTSDVHEFEYDVTGAGKSDGFNARIVTNPVPSGPTYRVDIRVKNGDQTVVRKQVRSTENRTYPVEIVSKHENKKIEGIPKFEIEAVSKDDDLRLYFSLDGLGYNPKDSMYYGLAYVLLTDPTKGGSSVDIGDVHAKELCQDTLKLRSDFAKYGLKVKKFKLSDTTNIYNPEHPLYPDTILIDSTKYFVGPPADNPTSQDWCTTQRITPKETGMLANLPDYGDKCIDTILIRSQTPQGFFVSDFKIPDRILGATTKALMLDLYSLNFKKNTADHRGSAYSKVQIK